MIKFKNILYHELIGLYCEVFNVNKSFTGICGIVIDETKKTLLIEKIVEDKIKEKLVPKDVSIFHFKLPDGDWVEINGKILVNRPEDRIKRKYRKI